jgi:DNA-binding protein HU-beta
MNKAELIDAVASSLHETKAGAARAVDAVLAGIEQGLVDDARVSLSGFGTFKTKTIRSRTGVNPATGERLQLPATQSVSFTPSPAMRDALPMPEANADATGYEPERRADHQNSEAAGAPAVSPPLRSQPPRRPAPTPPLTRSPGKKPTTPQTAARRTPSDS